MQAVQSNIIRATGRLFINWNTPNLKSVPFTQLQYLPPDEAHEYGKVILSVVKDGQTELKQFAIDPKNIHKLDIPGGIGILMQIYNSNEKVFIAICTGASSRVEYK